MKLAAREFGSEGRPFLLLHGLGGDSAAWEAFAPHLNGRAVAVDLRGHGRSPDGPWGWEAVLDDLDETAVHFGLADPVVVGHSLGGVLAALWALRHPTCPAAVSLDGHRSAATHLSLYEGLEDEELPTRLNAIFTAQLETITRPDRSILTALRTAPEFLDALPVFAQVTSPFLLVLATRNLPVPPDLAPLMDAHRAGLRRDLPVVCPNVRVHELDATHGMVVERPAELAGVVSHFVNNLFSA
ncbi:Pimeloyl-ACP methyl ester carboxylesterase [Lentzea fradiae]|uniref:Pimeloyl-ACP methyl ester carboxylesterase n=1 Tax=Lentzea fradiae TaxID=200378 RepID=A0A1G7ZCM4_9PSEU|nr:alpha/beta hydrolase [Lentzea fradiae]SDH06492.1 Pimeloyl-ACP methyl ester carboxylesterase [Lentzea fradiae]